MGCPHDAAYVAGIAAERSPHDGRPGRASKEGEGDSQEESGEGTSVMSNLDDNIEIIEEQGSGFAGFRAFKYDPAHRGACLRSIVSKYWWKQGELEASGVPKFSNHYGFYAYINLPLAILAFGMWMSTSSVLQGT